MMAMNPVADMRRKEKFDFAKFARLYPHDKGTCLRLGEDTPEGDRKFYEERYNADQDVLTIADFAIKLDRIDETT